MRSSKWLGSLFVLVATLLNPAVALAQVDIPIVHSPDEQPTVAKQEFHVEASGSIPEYKLEQYVVVYDASQQQHVANFVNNFIVDQNTTYKEVVISRAVKGSKITISPNNSFTQKLLVGQTDHFGFNVVDTNDFWGGVPKQLIEPLKTSSEIPVFSANVPVSVSENNGRFASSQLSFLTISRVVLTGGLNSVVIYFGSESVTSLLATGLAAGYFPAIEYFFQTYADEYALWLKKSNLVGRVSKRLAVGAGTLFLYSYLQDAAGIMPFNLWDFLITSSISTLSTHPFYELVVSDKPKSKFFEGKTVSYTLGLLGVGGVILTSMNVDVAGMPVGKVLLGSLAVTGTISVVHTFGMKSLVQSTTGLLEKAKHSFSQSMDGVCNIYKSLIQKIK